LKRLSAHRAPLTLLRSADNPAGVLELTVSHPSFICPTPAEMIDRAQSLEDVIAVCICACLCSACPWPYKHARLNVHLHMRADDRARGEEPFHAQMEGVEPYQLVAGQPRFDRMPSPYYDKCCGRCCAVYEQTRHRCFSTCAA
jgi:hypothetical protein